MMVNFLAAKNIHNRSHPAVWNEMNRFVETVSNYPRILPLPVEPSPSKKADSKPKRCERAMIL